MIHHWVEPGCSPSDAADPYFVYGTHERCIPPGYVVDFDPRDGRPLVRPIEPNDWTLT